MCVCVYYIYICVCVFVKSFICLAFYISLTEPIALSQAEQVALNYLMMESAYSLNGLATRLRSIEHQQALLLQLLDSIAAIARQPQLQTADLVWWAHSRIATPAVCLTAMRLLQPKKNENARSQFQHVSVSTSLLHLLSGLQINLHIRSSALSIRTDCGLHEWKHHLGEEDKLPLCCVVASSPVFALHAFNCLHDSIPYKWKG